MVKCALPKLISLHWARKKRETFWGSPGAPAPPSCEQPLPRVEFWVTARSRRLEHSDSKAIPLQSPFWREALGKQWKGKVALRQLCFTECSPCTSIVPKLAIPYLTGSSEPAHEGICSNPLHRWESRVLIAYWPAWGHTADEWRAGGHLIVNLIPCANPHLTTSTMLLTALLSCLYLRFIATCHHHHRTL